MKWNMCYFTGHVRDFVPSIKTGKTNETPVYKIISSYFLDNIAIIMHIYYWWLRKMASLINFNTAFLVWTIFPLMYVCILNLF